MNSDEIKGRAKGMAGKVQEEVGDVIGDRSTALEGAARQLEGRAQETYGQAREKLQDASQQVIRQVEQQPVVAVMVAGVVGFVLGLFAARR
jgi:uncharacterized protein YjbJ (UPF0337 family)